MKLYWRLYYRDGPTIDEPEGTLRPGRIFDARVNAVTIQLTEGDPAHPEIPRKDGPYASLRDPDTNNRCAPVFLRKVDIDFTTGQARIVATIFGRGWRGKDGSVSGSLWVVNASRPNHVDVYNSPDEHDLREVARCIDEQRKPLAHLTRRG